MINQHSPEFTFMTLSGFLFISKRLKPGSSDCIYKENLITTLNCRIVFKPNTWQATHFSLLSVTNLIMLCFVIKCLHISTLLDRIAHVCITTAHARRSGRSAKLEINKPSTSKLVRSLDEKLTVCLSPILHSALIFAHAQFYLRGCLLQYVWGQSPSVLTNISLKLYWHPL